MPIWLRLYKLFERFERVRVADGAFSAGLVVHGAGWAYAHCAGL